MTRRLDSRRPRAVRLAAACTVALGLAAPAALAAPTVSEFNVPTADGQPLDITQGPDGNLWFLEGNAAKIGRAVPGSPPTITDFDTPNAPGTTTPVSGLQNITVGPDGNIWFTGTNVVAEVPPGNPTGGTAYGGLGLADPRGIAAGPDNNLWIVDAGANDVKRVTTAGAAAVPPSISLDAVCGGRNIAKGPDDNMWVTCFASGKIVRIKGDASGMVPFPLATGSTPWDIISGPDGKLWFTGQKHDVGSITTAGSPKGFTSKGLDPFGITRGPDGALWYAEFGDSTIGRVTTSGVTSQVTGLGANAGPRYIAAGPSNTLWFTEQTANKIGRITGIVVPGGGGGGGGVVDTGDGGASIPPAKPSFADSRSSIRVSRKGRFKFSFEATPGLDGKAVFESVKKITVSRKKKVTLAKKSFTVPASGKVTLKIKLSRRRFRILKLNRRIRARVRITLTNDAGLTTKASKRIKLKAPKRRRR